MEDELRKAGEICRKIKKEIPLRVQPGESILDFANWLEGEIRKGGAEPSFPVNVSIDEIAAHFSPSRDYDGVFEEGQVVKVDFGAQIDGWITDNAVTIDLGENEELLEASKAGLSAATEVLLSRGPEATLSEIGSAIESAIKSHGFVPIVNLTGHSIGRWFIHGGLSIFNYDSHSNKQLGEGLFAIEPFATSGNGRVRDGRPSEIFRLIKPIPQRLPALRKLLNEISHFKTLPFSSRWVSTPQYLRMLVKSGVLHNYPELVEVSGAKVSQVENTFLIKDKVEIIT